jgi:MFS family permease
MWTFSNLDRSNIGNAYAGGMKESLNMSSTDYSVALLVFFIGYVVFEIPSNMLLVHLRPSLYLPAIMFWWGGVAIALAGCKNTPALAGVRVILGLAESGFAPGVLYLLSTWYKKKELARRYTLFWLGTPVSGMVGGILAGAIIERMDGISGMHGWQWLFVVSLGV